MIYFIGRLPKKCLQKGFSNKPRIIARLECLSLNLNEIEKLETAKKRFFERWGPVYEKEK